MNIARKLIVFQNNVGRNFHRKFQLSSLRCESTQASQPQLQEEKFDFEDLKVIKRVERRKQKIQPFMKNVFVSIFNKDMLAFPEILNKEETEALEQRLSVIDKVFKDPLKTAEERRTALKQASLFAGPVCVTRNGLAMNHTESLRYLEAISSDFQLGQEISDHWVALQAIQQGLTEEQYAGVIDDLVTGDRTIALCIKERVAERITQADFRTTAAMDSQGVWRVSGEKVCQNKNGYQLVLCVLEINRLKAFLVHPGSSGVTQKGTFINFMNTPATPLDSITEEALAKILGLSRLHAATLCRCHLKNGIQTVVDYVRPRAFGGKPLAELSTIRANVGEALLDVYASESAEYFTAGLLDGFEEPDAELEVAMCRNYMAQYGVQAMLKLMSIPALEKEDECKRLLDDMRYLSARGESMDSINTFIALNGIHHAGKIMAEEVKQIRNPVLHPTFIMKKMFANRHQERDDPKLTLFLAEHLHPSLKPPSEQLEYCVLRMRFGCETLMARHGMEVSSAYTELNRLAEAGTAILMMTSVLARASRAYCIGLRHAEVEMKLAACFVEDTKERVRKLIKDIDNGEFLNLDHFKVKFGAKVLDSNSNIVEKPTAKVFW